METFEIAERPKPVYGFHVVDDSIWRPIETAPTDRWVYLWEQSVAEGWPDPNKPYTPASAKWNDDEGAYLTRYGDYVKGATHWAELLPSPHPSP